MLALPWSPWCIRSGEQHRLIVDLTSKLVVDSRTLNKSASNQQQQFYPHDIANDLTRLSDSCILPSCLRDQFFETTWPEGKGNRKVSARAARWPKDQGSNDEMGNLFACCEGSSQLKESCGQSLIASQDAMGKWVSTSNSRSSTHLFILLSYVDRH
jgi:hypothetical protein